MVRELEGWPSLYKQKSGKSLGLTVTVVDRAYCSQVLRMWRSEEQNSGGPFRITGVMNRAKMRTEAEAYAARLNAGGRCAGGILPKGQDRPSLSPFDSGCPQ